MDNFLFYFKLLLFCLLGDVDFHVSVFAKPLLRQLHIKTDSYLLQYENVSCTMCTLSNIKQ